MAKDDGNDPFAPRDATVMRPRPGAGKRGAADAGTRGAAPGARSARRESADGVSGDRVGGFGSVRQTGGVTKI